MESLGPQPLGRSPHLLQHKGLQHLNDAEDRSALLRFIKWQKTPNSCNRGCSARVAGRLTRSVNCSLCCRDEREHAKCTKAFVCMRLQDLYFAEEYVRDIDVPFILRPDDQRSDKSALFVHQQEVIITGAGSG